MPSFTFQNIRITGMTAAVPTQKIDTISFTEQFGEEYVEKFQKNTGILSVRKTIEHQTASDLAYAAAESLLQKKAVDRQEIGAVPKQRLWWSKV